MLQEFDGKLDPVEVKAFEGSNLSSFARVLSLRPGLTGPFFLSESQESPSILPTILIGRSVASVDFLGSRDGGRVDEIPPGRSEERRGGEECRYRWAPGE